MKINLMMFSVFLMTAWLFGAEGTPHETDKEAVLAVHVENGTEGGHVAEGTEVTVNFYHGDHLAKQASVRTDSKGKCLIKDIPVGTEIVAVAQAKHSGMAFSSAPLRLPEGQKRYELSFQVFDVAYDNSLIRAGTHHLILKKSGGMIHVSEYIQLVNDSDKAVLSDKKDADNRPKVIELALPENFTALSFSSYFQPDAVVRTQTGFYDTMAIPPGSYHAVFSYDVPLGRDAIDFTKPLTLPTKSMMVFIQADSGITAELGEPAGQIARKDGTSTTYYTVDVSPGAVLKFHAEGMPVPKSQREVWVILGIVFSVIAGAALFRLIKQRSSV